MKAQNSFTARSLFITLTISVPYLKILTPLSLPSWNERIGGSPLNAVVSGLPHNTSSLREGQPIKAKSPSSSKMRLFARLRWSKLAKGIGGLYWSPEISKAVIFMSSCVKLSCHELGTISILWHKPWQRKSESKSYFVFAGACPIFSRGFSGCPSRVVLLLYWILKEKRRDYLQSSVFNN